MSYMFTGGRNVAALRCDAAEVQAYLWMIQGHRRMTTMEEGVDIKYLLDYIYFLLFFLGISRMAPVSKQTCPEIAGYGRGKMS